MWIREAKPLESLEVLAPIFPHAKKTGARASGPPSISSSSRLSLECGAQHINQMHLASPIRHNRFRDSAEVQALYLIGRDV